MPWTIQRQGGRYCVIKDGTEENEGCHGSRAEAERQMAALYASESGATKATYSYNGVRVQATQRRPSTRNDKKYMRTVTIEGTDYLVHYGDPNLEMQPDIPERRENFLARHNCSAKRDPRAPGFWACLDWERTEEGKAMDGNALKAIAKTDDELRVANYMVLFGGRDLEGVANRRKNRDGSTGEYFTKATQFGSAYTDTDTIAVDWEHGLAPDDEPGPNDILGRVDWKSARVDDKGLFVERVLNRRNQYVRYLEELIEAGLIGNSSEAIPEAVAKADDGEIKAWPIRRDTLTVAPMELRMLTQNALVAIKGLSQLIPSLETRLGAIHKTVMPEADKAASVEGEDRLLLELDLLELETKK